MSFKLLLAAAVPFAFVLAVGCSDDHEHDDNHAPGEHTSPYPSCQAIINACHPLDSAEGPIHDCHEIAHDNGASEAKCAAEKDRCVTTVCVAATDAGADAGADAEHAH